METIQTKEKKKYRKVYIDMLGRVKRLTYMYFEFTKKGEKMEQNQTMVENF